MKKIPCIKYIPTIWEYVKPYLEGWKYDCHWIKSRCYFNSKLYLVINRCGTIGDCDLFEDPNGIKYNREVITNVEEFLERAAKLKGCYYRRKDSTMTFNGIEIKPGMILTTSTEVTYIVFPSKNGLAGVNYHEEHTGYNCWYSLQQIIDNNEIVIIRDAPKNQIYDEKILWEKPKEIIITMDKIADKFGYPVEQIKIAK